MKLEDTLKIYSGGPGSGCNPLSGKCGRPSVMYHGTNWENAFKIINKGLKGNKSEKRSNSKPGYVYSTGSVDQARAFGVAYHLQRAGVGQPGKHAVVHFKADDDVWNRTKIDPHTKGDEVDSPSYMTKGDIPLHKIIKIDFYENDIHPNAPPVKTYETKTSGKLAWMIPK